MPTLHEQRRSVLPPADVNRCVVVGVGLEAACGADEARLVLAASTVHGSAGRVGLRGVVRPNLDHCTAARLALVGKLLKGKVVDGAADASRLAEELFLRRVRLEPVDVSSRPLHIYVLSMFHSANNAKMRERVFLPGLKAGLSGAGV